MFSDNELWLATITNPMFKLQWPDKEEDIERAKNMLTCEYKRLEASRNSLLRKILRTSHIKR